MSVYDLLLLHHNRCCATVQATDPAAVVDVVGSCAVGCLDMEVPYSLCWSGCGVVCWAALGGIVVADFGCALHTTHIIRSHVVPAVVRLGCYQWNQSTASVGELHRGC